MAAVAFTAIPLKQLYMLSSAGAASEVGDIERPHMEGYTAMVNMPQKPETVDACDGSDVDHKGHRYSKPNK